MKYPPARLPAEPPCGVTAGIDWASEDHAVCIVDGAGQAVSRFTVEHRLQPPAFHQAEIEARRWLMSHLHPTQPLTAEAEPDVSAAPAARLSDLSGRPDA
jgi:hypothetical protein